MFRFCGMRKIAGSLEPGAWSAFSAFGGRRKIVVSF